jgi:hypothetical protein
MELSNRDKNTLNKWKKPLIVAGAVILLILGLLTYLASSAEAQTQNLNYKLTWQHGAVAPDGSNRPDGNIIQQRVRNAGSTTFTAWTEIGRTVFPIAEFSDSIQGDPGGRTICYQVAAFNKTGTSTFTNEACVTTPVVLKIPVVPNNGQPVIIILGPVTVVP